MLGSNSAISLHPPDDTRQYTTLWLKADDNCIRHGTVMGFAMNIGELTFARHHYLDLGHLGPPRLGLAWCADVLPIRLPEPANCGVVWSFLATQPIQGLELAYIDANWLISSALVWPTPVVAYFGNYNSAGFCAAMPHSSAARFTRHLTAWRHKLDI